MVGRERIEHSLLGSACFTDKLEYQSRPTHGTHDGTRTHNQAGLSRPPLPLGYMSMVRLPGVEPGALPSQGKDCNPSASAWYSHEDSNLDLDVRSVKCRIHYTIGAWPGRSLYEPRIARWREAWESNPPYCALQAHAFTSLPATHVGICTYPSQVGADPSTPTGNRTPITGLKVQRPCR